MSRLLRYRMSDGAITGCWEGPATYLEAQVDATDPTVGYLEDVVADVPLPALFEQWHIIAEVVTAKAGVTLLAAPTSFEADGTTICLVTVQPFVACTLLVNGTPVELTLEDTTLELTSDVPATFTIALQPMGTHWAMPVTVEAT
jgi:hypothetical protein